MFIGCDGLSLRVLEIYNHHWLIADTEESFDTAF